MRRHPRLTAVLTASVLALPFAAAADAKPHGPSYPAHLDLTLGFQPEGIDIIGAHRAFLGSLADGDVVSLNLRTGTMRTLVEGDGTPAVGLKVDQRGRAFVAGGPSGTARVVDLSSGQTLQTYTFSTDSSFVNDVVFLHGDAYFTDSSQAQLYKLPIGPDGELPPADGFETLPLTGDWTQVEGFNANGIAKAPDHKGLLVVNSTTGHLFRVDPDTGEATEVDLGSTTLVNGDGLLTHSRTLYAVQNQDNAVAVIKLDKHGTTGSLTRTITSDDFDVPTTIARFGSRLYLPNARFGNPDPANASYWVTKVSAKHAK